MSEARGGGREEQPHIQGAVAAQAQKSLEELCHFRGQQGQWPGGATPHPRSSGCTGAGGPREAIPR